MARKTFLIAAIALIAMGTAFAAGPGAGDPWVDAMKKTYGGTTITVAGTGHTSTDSMRAMVKDFTAATGIKVQWDIMEEGYLRQKLLMEHQSKTGVYDVLMIDAFNLAEYSPSGVAVPLKNFLDNKTLTPSWFDYNDLSAAFRNGVGAYKDTVYSVPIAGETRFLGYRKDLFDKYGKKPPKTLQEMLDLAKFFNGKEPGLYGIAMRAQRGIHFASGWMTLMYSLGGEFLDQKTWKPTCNTPGTISSLKYYIELLKQAPPDVGVYTHEEAISAFMAGKTAMWLDATAIAPWIMDPKKSTVSNKVAFAPPPAGPAGDYGVMAGWGIGISADSELKKQQAAWAFIVWMTSKANARQYVLGGGTPMRQSLGTDQEILKVHPYLPAMLEALVSADNLVKTGRSWIPPHPKAIKVLEIGGDFGARAFAGEMTAEEAMKQAQAACERAMAE
ncbi:MAG: sugar ABC transporter substrate-binding protein [Spirochaetota bacterium]